MKLGYCPIGNGSSIAPFDDVFTEKQDVSKSLEGVDAVVFWGGTDIHPSLYKQKAHSKSQVRGSPEPSARDRFEWSVMRYCKLHDIPMIGVCRGAQLMCAFAGGKLIQHVDGHHSEHGMTTLDGEIIITTSCHHQMMYPYDVPHAILATSRICESSTYQDGDDKEISSMFSRQEPEIVYFPKLNGLAIQGHPEWVRNDDEFAIYCNTLVLQYLFKESLLEV